MTSCSRKLGPAKLSQQAFEESNPGRALGKGFRFWSKNTSDGLETLCRHHPAIVAIGIFARNSN
jgi:hypothetical protein